jgi:hypothetical protein
MGPAARLRRGVKRGAIADFLLACALAGAAAASVLILADVLPASGPLRWPPVERLLALAVSLVALSLATMWRAGLDRPRATLLHARLADESVPDDESNRERYPGLRRQARRRRLSLRSVTRWVNTSPSGGDQLVDLVAVCRETAGALEAMMNSDWDGSRRLLASDMMWPAALGVGAQLPSAADFRMLELTGWPNGTGSGAAEAVFAPPRSSPPSLDGLTVERVALADEAPAGRVGLILAVTQSLRHLEPKQVFAGCGVGEYHVVYPSWFGHGPDDQAPTAISARQLTALARRLPPAMAEVKRRARGRELVVAAAIPSSLAMAVGWALASGAQPFFAGTYLLRYDEAANGYRPVRTHPSQPAGPLWPQ